MRGWKPHLPQVALPRDRRGQDAHVPRERARLRPGRRRQDVRVPRKGQRQSGISLSTRFHRIINHRNNRATGHPVIRPSDSGRDKARPSPARETRAVMCGGAGARTARPPRVASRRVRWQVVVTISCLGCFPYITGWKCRCGASCRTVVDLSGRRGQLGLGVMTMDGRDDQPPRPFTSMMSTQVKKPAGLYTLLHVLHGSFSPKR